MQLTTTIGSTLQTPVLTSHDLPAPPCAFPGPAAAAHHHRRLRVVLLRARRHHRHAPRGPVTAATAIPMPAWPCVRQPLPPCPCTSMHPSAVAALPLRGRARFDRRRPGPAPPSFPHAARAATHGCTVMATGPSCCQCRHAHPPLAPCHHSAGDEVGGHKTVRHFSLNVSTLFVSNFNIVFVQFQYSYLEC